MTNKDEEVLVGEYVSNFIGCIHRAILHPMLVGHFDMVDELIIRLWSYEFFNALWYYRASIALGGRGRYLAINCHLLFLDIIL